MIHSRCSLIRRAGVFPALLCFGGTDDSSARVQIGWFSNASSSNLRTQPVQQPWQIRQVSNTRGVAPLVSPVQQPWQIRQVSNLWVQIPRLNRDYLFQRTAKSARSSCFCDPPGHFRALGSPQASIPALTAVWIHYSKFASECGYTKRLLTE